MTVRFGLRLDPLTNSMPSTVAPMPQQPQVAYAPRQSYLPNVAAASPLQQPMVFTMPSAYPVATPVPSGDTLHLSQLTDKELSALIGRTVKTAAGESTNASSAEDTATDDELSSEVIEDEVVTKKTAANQPKTTKHSKVKASVSEVAETSEASASEGITDLDSLKLDMSEFDDIDDTAEKAGAIAEAGVRKLLDVNPDMEDKVEQVLGFVKKFGQDPVEFADNIRSHFQENKAARLAMKPLRPLAERLIGMLPYDTYYEDHLIDQDWVQDLFDWLTAKPEEKDDYGHKKKGLIGRIMSAVNIFNWVQALPFIG